MLKSFEVRVLVPQLCLTLCDSMDCSPPGSSIHWIIQARILEWVAIPFSRGSSWPRDRNQVSCIVGRSLPSESSSKNQGIGGDNVGFPLIIVSSTVPPIASCLILGNKWIMRNAGLEEAQAGIKIARRNIDNLRYVDDTTLMSESEEEIKSLLMKVKEEGEKVGLKLTFRKRRSWHLVPSLHGK